MVSTTNDFVIKQLDDPGVGQSQHLHNVSVLKPKRILGYADQGTDSENPESNERAATGMQF